MCKYHSHYYNSIEHLDTLTILPLLGSNNILELTRRDWHCGQCVSVDIHPATLILLCKLVWLYREILSDGVYSLLSYQAMSLDDVHLLLLLLLYLPCPLGTLGGICMLVVATWEAILGWLALTVGSSPLCSVLNCVCPVGHAFKVVVDQVTPTNRHFTWKSFLSTCSTPLESMGWHPPHMSKPLKPSLSQLVLPVFSRMVVFHILSHKVTPRMSWRHLIWNICSFLRSSFDTFHVLAPYS